jgi:hypothetical protein
MVRESGWGWNKNFRRFLTAACIASGVQQPFDVTYQTPKQCRDGTARAVFILRSKLRGKLCKSRLDAGPGHWGAILADNPSHIPEYFIDQMPDMPR